MEFLKDLIKIQQIQTLEKISDKLLTREEDKQCFIKMYDKPNYQIIRITNTKMALRKRVNIDELISNL